MDDPDRALGIATDERRAALLADIVGHPAGMATLEELDYMNPPLSRNAIQRHLAELQEVGVIREHELAVGERVRGCPHTFYGLTGEARDLFDRAGLFPEQAWQREYRSVEKTPRIRKIERLARPVYKR